MPEKNEIDKLFLRIAFEFSTLSKCVSHQVGAIIVKDGRILSNGYNGTPSGYINCNSFFDSQNFDRSEHMTWSDINEVHAEMNAILFCAKNGIPTEGATLYSTVQPCKECTKNSIQTGIKRIIFSKSYDRMNEILDPIQKLLSFYNIEYTQISKEDIYGKSNIS